ncbi:hypothetical protein D3C71_1199930 [compost metagenome]
MVPETVQLMVLVAGLCACAPALEMIRPAGIAPRRSAQAKRSLQCSCSASVASASASALATRRYVASMSASSGSPCWVLSRYLRSQMSSDAGCIGTLSARGSLRTRSSRGVLMGGQLRQTRWAAWP